MQHSGSYVHAYCGTCKIFLQWLKLGSRDVASLMCPDCGSDCPVQGKTKYRLMGGVMCLAAVEKPVIRKKRG